MTKSLVERESSGGPLVEQINKSINRELASPEVVRALLATTFKGLNEMTMKRAIMEGMIRGFTFPDFMKKDVYAIPFKDGYSLVTSIEHARKRGMRGGASGKSAPTYVDDASGNPLTCSVTVYRKGGHPDGYTALVYFSEYTTGRNLWLSKPRTMIAKVAEMHAFRMACPEELAHVYVEEEFESESAQKRRLEEATEESQTLVMGKLIKHDNDEKEISTEAKKDQADGSSEGGEGGEQG